MTGSDHNLWFTESSRDRIGRMTPAGVLSEFPIPTAGGSPTEIASGPDGNWAVKPGDGSAGGM